MKFNIKRNLKKAKLRFAKMEMKKILFVMALVLALVITVGSALAISITNLDQNGFTNSNAVEGKQFTYDLDVDVQNSKFRNAEADGWDPIYNPTVVESTGVFSWLPSDGETGDQSFKVEVSEDNGLTWETKTFKVKVEPVLEIVDLKLGKKGSTLVSYDDNITAAFKPGDLLTFQLKVKNKYTQASHELVDKYSQSLAPTIINIELDETVDDQLTGFPIVQTFAPNPFYLIAEEYKVVEFDYRVPWNIVTNLNGYSVDFNADGDDLTLPGNQYHSEKGLHLKVEQNTYDVSITEVKMLNDDLNDKILTCQVEKQNKNVQVRLKLVNTGLADEGVRVTLTNQALNLNEKKDATIIAESSNPGDQYVVFDLDEESITGQHELSVKVYQKSTYPSTMYDSDSITINGEDCSLSFIASSPDSTSVTLTKDGEPQEFSVTVSNPGNIPDLIYKWTVDDLPKLVGEDQSNFTFTPEALGTKTVKVIVNEGPDQISKSWTVQVVEVQPAAFQISEILFANVEREATVNTNFTVKNIGSTEKLTNVQAQLIGVDSDYEAQIIGTVPTELDAGEQESLTLRITVPEDEEGGKHSIGTIKFTGKNASDVVVTKEATIYVQPKSYLKLSTFEVNGDESNAEIYLNEVNDITLEILNDYTEDMTNVEVTVRLLDDNDDEIVELDSQELDELKDGDEEEMTFEMDLSDENLDSDVDEYTVEVTVEGDADDDTSHKIVETKTVSLEREDHKVSLKKVELTSNTLDCNNEFTTLHATVENSGNDDEDDVEIRVRNSALNIDLKETDIELDSYSGEDNEFKASFNLNVADAEAGTYTLTVEAYLNGEVEDTQEIELVIGSCNTANSQDQSEQDYKGITEDLQQKLVDYIGTRGEQTPVVKGSFRESSSYTILLSVVVILLFVSMVLALALLFVKKK